MTYLKSPKPEELAKFNEKYKFNLSENELTECHELLKGSTKVLRKLYEISEYVAEVKYPRTIGYRPEKHENTYNAWYWKCSVKGARSGKLSGKKIALKDNIFLAGIPLMNGSRVLEGFIPKFDATIVTRMLDEGVVIVGKSTCEDLCISGSGCSSVYGPVVNPWNPDFAAGGSSSGSGVLVATGQVDMAIGTDQGGSIRNPASHCGLVGLKPTFGLVPYTGICHIEPGLDHVGPMTKTVKDCAILLEVIAGFDFGNDGSQPSTGFEVPQYSKELEKPVNGIRIGIIKESFNFCTSEVTMIVEKAIEAIRNSEKFAEVSEITLPHHIDAAHVGSVLSLNSLYNLIDCASTTPGYGGLLSCRLSQAVHRGIKTEPQSLSDDLKAGTMFAAYIRDKYGPEVAARAQNMRLKHRKLYDKALEKYDVLITPTMSHTAFPLSRKDGKLKDQVYRNINTIQNRIPFNATHHPALTLNAGFSLRNGLPIGMQIIGQRWKDDILIKVAYNVEQILKHFQSRKLCL